MNIDKESMKHAERYHSQRVLLALAQVYPKGFTLLPKKPRILWPESINEIDPDLVQVSKRDLNKSLRYFTNNPRYLRSIISSSWYRDIHGNRVAMIAPWVKAEAQKRLDQQPAKPKPEVIYKH